MLFHSLSASILKIQKYTIAGHFTGENIRGILGIEEGYQSDSDRCVSLSIWKKMKDALDEVVDSITLADMAKEYAEKNPDATEFFRCDG